MSRSLDEGKKTVPPGRDELSSVRAGRLATFRYLILAGAFLAITAFNRRLWLDFFEWIAHYPSFFLIGLILVLWTYGLLGRGLGIWRLFLHERFWPRFFSAFGASVVAGQLMAATFLIETRFHRLSDGKVVNEDRTYERVARPLQTLLKAAGLPEWYWTFRNSQEDNPFRGDSLTLSGFGGGLRRSLVPRIGRSNGREYVANKPNGEDFGSRWITFTLVTAWPIWLLLWMPSLPLRAFEGLRFTPPKVSPGDSQGGGGNPQASAIRDWGLSLTPGWVLRFLGWTFGLCAGALFLYALFWVGIPLTAVLMYARYGRLDASPEQVYFFATIMFVVGALGVYFLLRIPSVYRNVSPGLAISALLWLLILIFSSGSVLDGVLGYCLPGDWESSIPAIKLALVVALVVYVTYSNGSSYKFMIPGLRERYAPPAIPARNAPDDVTPPPSAPAASARNPAARAIAPPGRLKLNETSTLSSEKTPSATGRREPPKHDEILEAWRGQTGRDKPKLAVVCVSGGALRSGIWTAVVLDAIGEGFQARKLDFSPHLRLITGASGGMLGAAAYVARRHDRVTGREDSPYSTEDALANQLKIDSMTAVARRMALHDLTSIFDPRPQRNDRGRELEESWKTILPQTFDDLRAEEIAGKIPSIVFSPMLVEDGRRLLISNLDLEFLTTTRGPILLDAKSQALYGPHLSQGALELRALFPREFPGFLLRTAVRLNASFPYVSPAVSLPTDPPRRVVDAGYYDNFGVNLACRWLHENIAWLVKNTSGVALIQVRDHLGQRDRFEYTDDVGPLAPINRALSFATAPLSGATKARYATTSFRNDEQVSQLDDLFFLARGAEFFRTVIFEFQNDGEVALNWQLSQDEVEELQAGMRLTKNQGRLADLIEWWG